MNNYFYIDEAGTQRGPIRIEEFQHYGVKSQTPIWCKGMREWRPAIEIVGPLGYQSPSPNPSNPLNHSNVPPTPTSPYPYQNQPILGQGNMTKPDNYMVWSILATLFCGFAPGLIAIIYASKVDKEWAEGNYANAKNSSDKAKMWCFIALGIGVLLVFATIIVAVA